MNKTSSVNNKKIFKNTVALYARMLLSMIVSLYTSRIVLNALGVDDYGIYGLVSSRPREFHPQPLSEPYVKVSLHTALRIQIISFDVHRVHILLANDKTDWVLSELYRLTNNEQI